MDNRKYQLVVKENDLIQKASYNLTATEQKLLCYVISKIKPTDKEFERYTISAVEFGELCGIDKKNIYTEFKQMVESFDSKAQWIKINDNNIYFRVFSEAEYNDKQGSLTLVLNSRLKAYLLEIQHNYTMYELWNILSLKSKYSIRLYELFKSYSFLHKKEFDIDVLRGLLCAEGYTLYGNFKSRVLDKAVKEINTFTDITVIYKSKQSGQSHKVTSITFYIEKKQFPSSYLSYLKTIDRINKKNRQTKGQISLFDLDEKDFKEDISNDKPIKLIDNRGLNK